jgi:hypothetical protein
VEVEPEERERERREKIIFVHMVEERREVGRGLLTHQSSLLS